MTTKAKPLHFFIGIKFNSAFYDTEIDKSLKDYVNYNSTNQQLVSNVNYIPTTITDLRLTSIGRVNQIFNLPTNTSTASSNSILTLTDNITKNTTWTTPPTVIVNYVNYDNTAKTIISNVSGTPTTITDLVISSSIGSSIAQNFVLPSNSSTSTIGQVLSILNATTKTTQWITIPTQISTYVTYSNPNLIYNVSGTPSNISNLTVGPLTCTTFENNGNTLNCGNITSGTINSGAINANSNLIETTGSLKSKGLTIQNVSNIDVCTIANTGSLIAKSLQAKAFTIKDPSNLDSATISSAGALVCTTIQTNGNTINGGSITGTSLSAGTGSITGGALSCTTITSNNNTITAGTSSVSGGSIISSTFNSGGISSVLDIGANQTTGILSIGNNASRTGAINIGTLTTGAHAINIGNSASTQTVNINRPLTTNSISTNNNTFTSGTGSITGGALSCTTITTNNNTFTSGTGSITGGALSCTTITSNNNTITAGTSSVSGGSIISSTFNSGGISSVLDIGANQTTGILSIGNNAGRTGAINIGTLTTGTHAINIGNGASTQTVNINRPLTTNTINTNNNTFTSGTGSITGGALSCTTITSNNNTITAGTSSVTGGSIISSTFNSSGISSVLNIGANQTTGILSIGNNAGRTGAINIGTLTTGTHAINIGNSASTQTVTINRPIRMPGLLYTTGQEIGYSQNNGVFFSASNPTPNPVIPGAFMNTPITTTNLINNANYLVNYYLTIIPQVNFNVTSFQYGLYSSSIFITGLNQKHTMYSTNATTTTTTRFLSTETYNYTGCGFLRYNSLSTYTFTFIMAFLAIEPLVQTGIEFIRIS